MKSCSKHIDQNRFVILSEAKDPIHSAATAASKGISVTKLGLNPRDSRIASAAYCALAT
jgi:hypothetical protein